jgi:hypothetical protein
MTVEKIGQIYAAEHKVHNAEFAIQFIQTNIRWMAGGEQTEEIKQRISQYKAEIKERETELILLRQNLKSIRGF